MTLLTHVAILVVNLLAYFGISVLSGLYLENSIIYNLVLYICMCLCVCVYAHMPVHVE